MAMSQQETFSWMVEELQRLRAEVHESQSKLVAATLELARLHVAPIVAREREGENITNDILDFRMRSA